MTNISEARMDVTKLRQACEVAAARATDTEAAGRLDPEVFDALLATGALRMWIPESHGGRATTVRACLEAIEQVSRADGAAGWSVMIANTTALTAAQLSEEWANTIFADPAACTGGYGMPAGVAQVVDGGLEVTGRWSWGSGTDHCTWIGGGVRVVDGEGSPTAAPDGATSPFVFFEPGDVTLHDTWHVSGLKGTASGDYSVERAFVPDGRWAQIMGGTPRLDEPLTRFSFFGALAAGVAAVTIGLAQHAIDELILIGANVPSGSGRSLAQRNAVQANLARAMAAVGQSRAWLYGEVDDAWNEAVEMGIISDDRRVSIRLAATAAAARCADAVDICHNAAGGRAIFESGDLQRVFRDVHVATQHGMISPRTLEPVGRWAFGLPTSLDQL